MVSSMHSRPHTVPSPPAVCRYVAPIVPIIPPIPGPNLMQGWARWTDLDPDFPIDVAMFVLMQRQGDAWIWVGESTMLRITLTLTLTRLADPNPWQIKLAKEWNSIGYEDLTWGNINMGIDPHYDSRLLTHIYIPGYDWREARVLT